MGDLLRLSLQAVARRRLTAAHQMWGNIWEEEEEKRKGKEKIFAPDPLPTGFVTTDAAAAHPPSGAAARHPSVSDRTLSSAREQKGESGEKMHRLLERGNIDLILVPSGLVILFGYHLYLLYKILRHPETTVIGYENHNKLAWVARMLKATPDEASLALMVIGSSMSASNTLASLSIGLSSLIGAWVASSSKLFPATVIYGDTTMTTTSVKYISILICFLVAFTSFIQSSRHYVHASFLMSTLDSDVPLGYVQTAVLRGGNFWSVGLRAMYFATSLLLWFFGPIPMFVCSVLMVAVLWILDANTLELHSFKFKESQIKARRVLSTGTPRPRETPYLNMS